MGKFSDKVKEKETETDFTMVKKINRTIKTVRVENELLTLIEKSGRSFSEVVNSALRNELVK